jgi:DNA replication protein DnaC
MLSPYIYKEIENESYAIPNQSYWKEINQKKFKLLLQRSKIPKFYWDIEFFDYVGEVSKENVDKLQYMAEHIYEEKFRYVNLYLWGTETGTQKTTVCCNFGKECIKKGLQVKFMLFGSFVNYLMKLQGFHRDEEADENIKELKQMDVILLDDCFDPNKSMLWKKESSRELIVSEIDNFFREQIYNNKKFVLTSNLSPEMIKENYGKFLYDLIDRNFISFSFLDSVVKVKKERLSENLFCDK